MKVKKAKLRYTDKEWEKIEDKIGKCDVHSYINRKITSLAALYEKCPPCVSSRTGIKIEKQHCFSGGSLEIIKKICEDLNADPSILISRFILDPLLFDE
jgi:hypothetical protein